MSQTYDEIEKKDQSNDEIEVLGSQFTIRGYVRNFIRYFIYNIIFCLFVSWLWFIPVVRILAIIYSFIDVAIFVFLLVFFIIAIAKHRTIFYADDGVRIGRTYEDSTFIPWDKVTFIDYQGEKYGRVFIDTSIPRNKSSKNTKLYFVDCVYVPAEVSNRGQNILVSKKVDDILNKNRKIESTYYRFADVFSHLGAFITSFFIIAFLLLGWCLYIAYYIIDGFDGSMIGGHKAIIITLSLITIVALALVCFLVTRSIIQTITGAKNHMDIFLEKDGFRIGKSYDNSKLWSWDNVTDIKMTEKGMKIFTSLFDEKNPNKDKTFVVSNVYNLLTLKEVACELNRLNKTNKNNDVLQTVADKYY